MSMQFRQVRFMMYYHCVFLFLVFMCNFCCPSCSILMLHIRLLCANKNFLLLTYICWCTVCNSLSSSCSCSMRSRRRSCLLTLLLAMTVNHHTPVVSASVILRGRWSATIDEADASSSSGLNGKFDHLQSLMQVLRDHRRPLSASSLTRLDSGMANRLLPAFDRQVGTGWLTS